MTAKKEHRINAAHRAVTKFRECIAFTIDQKELYLSKRYNKIDDESV